MQQPRFAIVMVGLMLAVAGQPATAAQTLSDRIAALTKGFIIGEPVTQEGIIVYPVKSLFLCSSSTNCNIIT